MYIFYTTPYHLKRFRRKRFDSNLYQYLNWISTKLPSKTRHLFAISEIRIDYYNITNYPNFSIPFRFYSTNKKIDKKFQQYPIIIKWKS